MDERVSSSAAIAARGTVRPTRPCAVRDLTKIYGAVTAVDHISFTLAQAHHGGAAWRQRRRQDHDHRHAARPRGAELGRGEGVRRRHGAATASAVAHRMNFQSPYVDLPVRLTVRQNLHGLCRALRRRQRGRAHRLYRRGLADRGAARPADRQAVGRPEDARRSRQGAAQRARAAPARRADRLARSRHRRLGQAEAQGLCRARAAPRSCSPRTTWPRSSGLPIASSCSMPAASSRTTRRPV